MDRDSPSGYFSFCIYATEKGGFPHVFLWLFPLSKGLLYRSSALSRERSLKIQYILDKDTLVVWLARVERQR
jgi:hypothetical protein